MREHACPGLWTPIERSIHASAEQGVLKSEVEVAYVRRGGRDAQQPDVQRFR